MIILNHIYELIDHKILQGKRILLRILKHIFILENTKGYNLECHRLPYAKCDVFIPRCNKLMFEHFVSSHTTNHLRSWAMVNLPLLRILYHMRKLITLKYVDVTSNSTYISLFHLILSRSLLYDRQI